MTTDRRSPGLWGPEKARDERLSGAGSAVENVVEDAVGGVAGKIVGEAVDKSMDAVTDDGGFVKDVAKDSVNPFDRDHDRGDGVRDRIKDR